MLNIDMGIGVGLDRLDDAAIATDNVSNTLFRYVK